MQPLVPLVFHNLPSLYPPSFRFFILVRSAFMLELRRELGDRFEHFQVLIVLRSHLMSYEAWEEYSSGLLTLIKDFVLSVYIGGKEG